METDITVTKIDHDQFLIITSTAQATRDADWIRRQLEGTSDHVTLTDVTSAYSVFSLMGPKSRALLSTLTTEDLANEAFPFGTSKSIDLGYGTVRANRITYVGELGYELIVPSELATYVYEQISSQGEQFGLRNAGYYAIDSLRMEKGYRAWGAELSPDWTPFECGLGFAVKLAKKEDFVGKTALAALKGKRLEKQLLTFTIDDGEAFPWGSESVLFNGQTVGYVTSAAYGHTVGRGVVFAMIKGVDALAATKKGGPGGKFEIEINGLLYSLTATTKPVYDPTGERVKC